MTPQQNLFSEHFEIEHWVNRRIGTASMATERVIASEMPPSFDDEPFEDDDLDWV